MTINQNQIPSEPELKDVLDLLKKDILLTINCHHIGTVQSFDPLTQTAKVTINYKRTFFRPNAAGVYNAVAVDYPIIIDAPVISLGGGSGILTFPIESGDECLVLFNDRNIDNWFTGSSDSPVPTPRLHSFSDAIILVGVRSLANVVLAYNSSEPEFRNKLGTTKVKLAADGRIDIENTVGTLGGLIQDLITQLTSLTTQLQALTTATAAITFTSGTDPNPQGPTIAGVGTQIGAIATQITTIKAQFAGLLE